MLLVPKLIPIYNAQSAGAVEYTNCFSAEGQNPTTTNECPVYDIKQSDDEVPVMLEYPFIAIAPRSISGTN